MTKIGSGKSAHGWAAVVLLSYLSTVIAQPGFISIDCGGKTNQIDGNNIIWVTDANYTNVGKAADIRNRTLPSYLQTLRMFPKPLNKSCYQLPVVSNVRYLLRLWFAVGNYTVFRSLPSFQYSIETLGLLTVKNITVANTDPFYGERILVSSGNMLYICFMRTSETDDPFISAIELRTLRDGMYREAQPGTMLKMELRYGVGGNSYVRYPKDEFDRLWTPANVGSQPIGSQAVRNISSDEPISTNNTQDLPPYAVMQTALESEAEDFVLTGQGNGNNSILLLYFSELETLNASETRSFYVSINGEQHPEPITPPNHSTLELPFPISGLNYILHLIRAPTSSLDPLINGVEYYVIVDTEPPTYIKDIEALDAIKTSFPIRSWIADPCYIIEWDGISCDKSSGVIRISEINLAGMNLAGSVPQSIDQLTALVNLSLDNNHLTGPLPNLSNLSKLERLHLQNNMFTGTVPDWLCGLKNLKELFIENNSFSGVIPSQLLSDTSLEFRYSGNPNLHVFNNNNNRLGLVLGITISGAIIILLVLIVLILSVLVHRKKSGRKESNRVEKESKHSVDEDNSMITLPDTTKSRAFSLEEIMAATKKFSQKIGEGGFGSVFFGKLEQGTDIAVKVLSLIGEQGIHEFLNEVDLLSRVHHKNLVSLLGYCNESKELMLVYEHMSAGSLRDHLYGPAAELSQLNWKTRLKIASDAAEGLQYLHVGCIPKIIHRDIKSANILLDRNFNGKLGDFGLSRITIDGEASHVTTTVKGTLGYLDPEYFSTQMLTEKSDVYSFGVVLLEIVCGRQPIDAKLPGEQLNLIRWVTPYVGMEENPEKIAEIIDKRLGRSYDIKSISGVAKLAIRCVQEDPSFRPHVSEVVAELKEAIQLEKHKVSLTSEMDIEYDDLSVDSSAPKEIKSAEISSSKSPTEPLE